MVLGDRTGDVEAKMWDNAAEVMDTFERDDFLKVRGLLQIYQNRLQLTIHKLQKQPDDQVDFTDFFPASTRNTEEMFAELCGIVQTLENPFLRALLSGILDDPDVARRYRIAPAAKNVHHAYIGGLIEHVLSMCSVAKLLGTHYKDIDMDLLLAGVILHDIGKIHELTYDRSFGYSSEGQLLGHIMIGVRMIEEKAREIPGFPARLRSLLQHMILSHHGELEYGSPKVPVFPEALLLHHIDNLDSKMECMRAFIEKDRYVDGCWTGFSPSLERSVLKKRKYLEDAPPQKAQEAAASGGPRQEVRQQSVAPPPRTPPTTLLGDKLKLALGDK
jgi:3'-5' exoribonuclease